MLSVPADWERLFIAIFKAPCTLLLLCNLRKRTATSATLGSQPLSTELKALHQGFVSHLLLDLNGLDKPLCEKAIHSSKPGPSWPSIHPLKGHRGRTQLPPRITYQISLRSLLPPPFQWPALAFLLSAPPSTSKGTPSARSTVKPFCTAAETDFFSAHPLRHCPASAISSPSPATGNIPGCEKPRKGAGERTRTALGNETITGRC